MAIQHLLRRGCRERSKSEDTDAHSEEGAKMRAIEKGCRPADNITASKRRTNVLKKYINRIRAICLLNAFASLILAVIYTQTRNESIFAAMVVCEVNAMIAWAMS